jgi:hypothetical protein
MLDVAIESTEPLPSHLQWVEQLKTEAETLANRLSSSHPRYAERVEQC